MYFSVASLYSCYFRDALVLSMLRVQLYLRYFVFGLTSPWARCSRMMLVPTSGCIDWESSGLVSARSGEDDGTDSRDPAVCHTFTEISNYFQSSITTAVLQQTAIRELATTRYMSRKHYGCGKFSEHVISRSISQTLHTSQVSECY